MNEQNTQTEVQMQAPQLQSNEEIIDGKKVVTYAGYGGFWYRFAAYLLDSIVASFIIPIFFNIYFYFAHGDTIGYKALRLKIVDTKTGQKPGWGSLLLRFIYKIGMPLALPIIGGVMLLASVEAGIFVYLAGIVLSYVFWIVYGIWIAAHPKKQAPYDQMAKTMVVRKEGGSSAGVIVAIVITVIAVIGIIGVLSAVVLTSLDASREKAMDAKSVSDMKQIALALELERDQTTGDFPAGVNFPVQELSAMLSPFPQGDYKWIDNTGDASQFCAYATLSSDIGYSGGKYFYVSEEGSGYLDSAPYNLQSCGEGLESYSDDYDSDFNLDFEFDDVDFDSMTDTEFDAFLNDQYPDESGSVQDFLDQ